MSQMRWLKAKDDVYVHITYTLLLNDGLLLTYGLATRHACYACYAPATRPLLAVDLHMWFSQDEEVFTQQVKQHDNLETKYKTSKQRFICRSRIPTPGCQSMRKCVEVCRLQYEKKPA